jgi:hypothetical protein
MIGYYIYRFLQPRISFLFISMINLIHLFFLHLCEIPLFLTYWSSGDRVSTTDLRLPPVSVIYYDWLWIHEILGITSLLPPAGNILEFEPETEIRIKHRNRQHEYAVRTTTNACPHARKLITVLESKHTGIDQWKEDRGDCRPNIQPSKREWLRWNRLRDHRLRDRHRLLHLSHHLTLQKAP